MTSLDPGRLATTHPELFDAPFAGRAPFRTLSELGLRFADDARARGYVQVRPAVSAKGRTVAALWLDPAQWPDVEALLPEVAAFRERREAARAEHDSQRRARRAQARREAVLARLALLAQRSEEDVEARLGAAVVDEVAASALPPEEALLRTIAPAFRGQPVHDAEPAFHVGPAVLPATAARHVAALVEGGPAALADVLETDLAALEDAARELAARWAPTRPTWFEREALDAWALSVVSTGKNGRHPIFHFGVARELLSEDPVVGTTQFLSAEARLKAPVEDVLARLWSTPDVDRRNLKRAIRDAIADVARRPLEAAAAELPVPRGRRHRGGAVLAARQPVLRHRAPARLRGAVRAAAVPLRRLQRRPVREPQRGVPAGAGRRVRSLRHAGRRAAAGPRRRAARRQHGECRALDRDAAGPERGRDPPCARARGRRGLPADRALSRRVRTGGEEARQAAAAGDAAEDPPRGTEDLAAADERVVRDARREALPAVHAVGEVSGAPDATAPPCDTARVVSHGMPSR